MKKSLKRITVSFVLKSMASGMTEKEILKAYPELELKDLHEVIEYASWLASDYHRPFDVSDWLMHEFIIGGRYSYLTSLKSYYFFSQKSKQNF